MSNQEDNIFFRSIVIVSNMRYQPINVPDFNEYKLDFVGKRSQVLDEICQRLQSLIPMGYGNGQAEAYTSKAKEISDIRWNCTCGLRFLDKVVYNDGCTSLRERAGKTIDSIKDQLEAYGHSLKIAMN
jgi:hypothetical protein